MLGGNDKTDTELRSRNEAPGGSLRQPMTLSNPTVLAIRPTS